MKKRSDCRTYIGVMVAILLMIGLCWQVISDSSHHFGEGVYADLTSKRLDKDINGIYASVEVFSKNDEGHTYGKRRMYLKLSKGNYYIREDYEKQYTLVGKINSKSNAPYYLLCETVLLSYPK